MDELKIIELRESVFADNDADARLLRQQLSQEGKYLINLMSAPGSGKTSTLLALADRLKDRLSFAVMEADIDSDVDARAMLDAGIESIQLHTGGMCHLDADMCRQGLRQLEGSKAELVILENVGNLVCPAEFDTGAHLNITILSVPEGHDKPLKYPLMYEKCRLLVVNKTDVLPHFDFDCTKLEEYARMRNPDIDIIYISAKTGQGVDELAQWILKEVNKG